MSILGYIERDEYFVTTESDVVWTDNDNAGCINLSHNVELVSSLDITEGVIKDACFLKKTEFSKKYESKLNQGARMKVDQIYRALRKIIVDDKIPIHNKKPKVVDKKPTPLKEVPKSRAKSPKSVKKPEKSQKVPAKKGSRKDQVRDLLKSGVTDPKEIATQLGTHPSYVWRLIKEING